jgi:hypothetical protein
LEGSFPQRITGDHCIESSVGFEVGGHRIWCACGDAGGGVRGGVEARRSVLNLDDGCDAHCQKDENRCA